MHVRSRGSAVRVNREGCVEKRKIGHLSNGTAPPRSCLARSICSSLAARALHVLLHALGKFLAAG